MPKKPMLMSYTTLRMYTEKFQWTDALSGEKREGFNPPQTAKDVERKPFYIKYITGHGKVEEGVVTCIKVDPKRLQRSIKFEKSGEIRIVRDYLVIEVDGVKFFTH